MATSTLGSGTLVLAGTTSGTTTVTATAVAGTTTLTLPAATDTLVGKATTDTLTNKTLTTPSVSSPTISDGTANGVPYLNGSKVLTTGSALSFDGSSLVGTGKFQSNLVRIKDASYSELYFSTADAGGNGAFSYEHSTNSLRTYVNGGIKTVIDSSGNLQTIGTVSVGNATPSASGAGITFPATQSASSNANTLDDYEEGTWTPAFTSLTTTGTASFTGTYTKIGRVLYWKVQIATTGTTASVAGTTFINNLPFPLGTDRPTFIAQASDFVGCNSVGWIVSQTQARTPTWSATASDIYLSGIYETT